MVWLILLNTRNSWFLVWFTSDYSLRSCLKKCYF